MLQRRERHILSLSGGKDSTALALYMRDRIPQMEYVFCDTGKELPETYTYLNKIEAYGPKGTGILYVRDGTPLLPLHFGGGQEQGKRSGTQNVPGIVGTALALRLAAEETKEVAAHCKTLRLKLIHGITEVYPDATLTGHPEKRLPGNASFVFKGCEGEALVLGLARMGIAASTGSACSTGALEPSHVLLAMGFNREDAWGSVRLTLGRESTQEDVNYTLAEMDTLLGQLIGKR